jgi:hypothetical protein
MNTDPIPPDHCPYHDEEEAEYLTEAIAGEGKA